jgi:sugar lactone lactonase YvrE
MKISHTPSNGQRSICRLLTRLVLMIVLEHILIVIGPAQSIVGTYAGNGSSGFGGDGGPATSAKLQSPSGIAMDAAGNLFIADKFNQVVRKVTSDGRIETVAGTGTYGSKGEGVPATSANLADPGGVAVDAAGNLYIADSCNSTIRKVGTNGIITTFASGFNFCYSYYYYYYYDYFYPAATVGMVFDAAGNLYVTDTFNNRIQKITPGGVKSVAAGSGLYGFSGDGGQAIAASLAAPTGVAVDAAGNLFIADTDNSRIRKVGLNGVITTVAGTNSVGFVGDGGPASSAQLSYPTSVALDASGNLFIGDSGNARVRQFAPNGIITTVAGNGSFNFAGDGGSATNASFFSVSGIAVDTIGNLYVSDSSNNRIRKIAFIKSPPVLASIVQNLGSTGGSFNVVLNGSYFFAPFTVSAEPGITLDDVRILSDSTATARMTVASNAALGPRNVTVTTPVGTSNAVVFNVADPFPDLSVKSSHSGTLAAGFNGVFTVGIQNAGFANTSVPLTLTGTLPSGLHYVSGTGTGWACSLTGQTMTCGYSAPLAAGETTNLSLTVAVESQPAAGSSQEISVVTTGDPISTNNSASDPIVVVGPPSPTITFGPGGSSPGRQSGAGITLPAPFPFDVTGKLTLSVTPDAANPSDDPSIQFATGGRQVSFVIPANTLTARFGNITTAGMIGFQTGTVAAKLTFEASFDSAAIQTKSATQTIARGAPVIQNAQITSGNSTEVAVTLSATSREVTQMTLTFWTTPAVQLSCGSVPGCVASKSTLTLDVKSLFDSWYSSDSTFGGVSRLRFPFAIKGSISGSITVRLRNSQGDSNQSTFIPLPASK